MRTYDIDTKLVRYLHSDLPLLCEAMYRVEQEHKDGDEIMDAIYTHLESIDTHEDPICYWGDVAEALYFISLGWYEGMYCPMYTLTSTEYTPGMCADGCEPESSAADLFDEIEWRLEGKPKSTLFG